MMRRSGVQHVHGGEKHGFTGARPGGANVPTCCQNNQLEFVLRSHIILSFALNS